MDEYWIFKGPHKELPVSIMKRALDFEWRNLDFTQTDWLLTNMCSKSPYFSGPVFSSGKWSDWTRFVRSFPDLKLYDSI